MTSRPLLILVCGCTLAGPVAAGSLDALAAPTDAGSAMYTLNDLFNRLTTGTAGTPRTGAFVEPAAGPGGTMHTLTDIMGKMPALDNTNGATVANMLAGKTFWGLTSGAWGLKTGTMPTQTVNKNTTSQSAGYYDTFDLATVDIDLTVGNIKSGVSIFGLAGTYVGSGATFSAPFPVAKTGQTIRYDGNDDGYWQKGAAWPSPRFTDNSNGTVTDNLTGLVWLRLTSCNNLPWNSAQSWVTGLASGSCGLSDGSVPGQWRLPTIKELSSLVNAGASYPALPSGHPFTGSMSGLYWSSTTYAPSTSSAWQVVLDDGRVGVNSKAGSFMVWPVRGGQ